MQETDAIRALNMSNFVATIVGLGLAIFTNVFEHAGSLALAAKVYKILCRGCLQEETSRKDARVTLVIFHLLCVYPLRLLFYESMKSKGQEFVRSPAWRVSLETVVVFSSAVLALKAAERTAHLFDHLWHLATENASDVPAAVRRFYNATCTAFTAGIQTLNKDPISITAANPETLESRH